MATQIGVRELKNQASKIVRAVREEAAEYIITVNGNPVAVLRPLTKTESQHERTEKVQAFLAELDALSYEITAEWESEKTAVELVNEQRRG
jgi:prevent-host-death family protein